MIIFLSLEIVIHHGHVIMAIFNLCPKVIRLDNWKLDFYVALILMSEDNESASVEYIDIDIHAVATPM